MLFLNTKVFFNGLVEPETSWWPKLIPLKPDGMLNVYGFVKETGTFDFGLSGRFGIVMPSSDQAAEGMLRATNEALTMQAIIIRNGEAWGALGTFQTDQTEYVASPPEGFLDGISNLVENKIDSSFSVALQTLEDLNEAAANYEIELSLRGLREVLPAII